MGGKRLLALFLGLVVLGSTALAPLGGGSLVSAEPDDLKWSIVDTPSEEGYVVVNPSEVNALVLGSDEVFYAIDIPGEQVFKSVDRGVTWEDDLTETLGEADPAADLPAWDLAVAPDDPDLVAVVTDERQEVYVSEDGGETWVATHVAAAVDWDTDLLIADIAISPEYDGKHDIAIGTRNPDGVTNGDVWVVQPQVFSVWEAQGLDMDVTSVRFSPDHEDDKTILAIASDTEDSYLCTGYRNTNDNTTDWSVTIPAIVEISDPSEDSPAEDEIIFSDLALPSSYCGDEADERLVYASYSSGTEADDVYRIEDSDVYRLDVDRGVGVDIASIAFSDGRLLVGEVASRVDEASALLHTSFNPEDSRPDWEEPAKPPTGGFISGCANAQVALIVGWDPETDGKRTYCYCGTSTNHVGSASDWADTSLPGAWSGNVAGDPDESAFSRSEDDCGVWNQLSLIDTDVNRLCDYALWLEDDPDEVDILYLASVGSGFDSIWRSTSDPLGDIWERVLCLYTETDYAESDVIILRHTPEDSPGEAIFLAVRGNNSIQNSLDQGQTWKRVKRCPNVTDLAVVSNELLYVLDDYLVHRAIWTTRRLWDIWEWEMDIDTGLLSGYSIAFSGKDFVFVGDDGDEGKIAYSSDGGDSFELTEALPELGKVLVIPDDDFYGNRFIYAATDDSLSGIHRWAIGGSTSWRGLNPPNSGFYGLAQKGGALYGAYGPGVDRTLIPHMATVLETDWDSLAVGLSAGVSFRPSSLRATVDAAVDLWAIDDRDYDFPAEEGCVWVYSDTFALRTPWPTSPAIGETIPCDPCACQSSVFCFCWRELPLAEQYELWIAIDEKFDYVLLKVQDITPIRLDDPGWCPFEGEEPFRFVCGHSYYWKLRSSNSTEGERIHSRWSPPMMFIIAAGASVEEMHVAPILKAPKNGGQDVSRSPGFSWIGFPPTTKYEFVLAEDAAFTQVLVREELNSTAYVYAGKLDWGRSYLWQVRAIEPALSEAATGTFTVMLEPEPVIMPPSTVTTVPQVSSAPFWVWIVIGILALLAGLVVALCFTTRR